MVETVVVASEGKNIFPWVGRMVAMVAKEEMSCLKQTLTSPPLLTYATKRYIRLKTENRAEVNR